MIKKLGKYEVLGVLGRGSMGVVYKGIDKDIGKMVAIKTMNQKILQQSEMKERFYREGTILGQLQHQNIISVYNAGVDGDIYYIAMEYLEGISLDHLLVKERKLPIPRTIRIIKQVCDGVHAAHNQSVIHRDLKPANIILLEDDHVKVLDFGVAHFQNSQLTNSGMLLGTINYIAPEQITGLKVDSRADIFSMGVILYELLSGKNPFLGRNISQTMVNIVNNPVDPLPDIPKELQTVLDKALHKDRNRRYINARLMGSDLERVLRQTGTGGGTTERSSTLSTTRPTSEPAGAGLDKGKRSQQEILQKMIRERVEAIKNHIRREEFGPAEEKLSQLKRLDRNHESIAELEDRLGQGRRKGQEKRNFVEQLTHDTLAKANEHLAQRHYVLAIELCEKVLKVDAGHQDAKVIKANAIRKLDHYLAKVR